MLICRKSIGTIDGKNEGFLKGSLGWYVAVQSPLKFNMLEFVSCFSIHEGSST
jgi:hypothetical protein